MSLKQKNWVRIGVLAVGLIAAIAKHGTWLGGIGFMLILVGLALDVAWMRCPRCGIWLGRYPGEYCKNCGKKVDYQEKR